MGGILVLGPFQYSLRRAALVENLLLVRVRMVAFQSTDLGLGCCYQVLIESTRAVLDQASHCKRARV